MLLAGLAQPVGVLADDSEPIEDPTALTEAEAVDVDAAIYAQRFGVTPAEARHRFDLREDFSNVIEVLEDRGKSHFAGAEVDHGSDYRFVVTLKGNGGVAAELLADPALGVDQLPVEIKTGARFSQTELQQRADNLHDSLVRAGASNLSTWFDTETGRVHAAVGHADTPEVAVLKGHVNDFIPPGLARADVDVEFFAGSVAQDQHTYGGALTTTSSTGTSGCTTGFTVTSGGIATAGHCSNDRWYNMAGTQGSGNTYQMTYQAQHKGNWGDFQWHTTGHTEYDDFYYSWGSRRDVSGVQQTVVVNDFVCFFGRVTGPDTDCDLVYKPIHTTTVDGVTYRNLVAVAGNPTLNGDSGGPWYLGGTAWGIHKGRSTIDGQQRGVFSRAEYIDEALGVNIATS